MDKEDFEKFLQDRYYPALQHYYSRAFRNQQIYRWIEWAIIGLSLVTAILVAIEGFFDWLYLKLSAVVTSVIVTSLAAALKTLNSQAKSAFYSKVCNRLENEYDIYKSGSEVYESTDNKESFFVIRVRAILNEASTIKDGTIPSTSIRK